MWKTKKNIVMITLRTIHTRIEQKGGLFLYQQLLNRCYIKIWGPDAVKFINGTITSKLQPIFQKKNLTTINSNDKSLNPNETIINFDINKGNWGLYQEMGPHGEFISQFGQYTGLLNGKGKILTDSILYPLQNAQSKYPEFLLEFNSSIADNIFNELVGHKLSSRIKIDKLDSLKKLKTWDISIKFNNVPEGYDNPWIDNLIDPMSRTKDVANSKAFYNNVITSLFRGLNNNNVKCMYVERRLDKLLYSNNQSSQLFRVVTDDSIDDIGSNFNIESFPFELDIVKLESNDNTLKEYKLSQGLIDVTEDIKPNTLLPLELNYDQFLNVVSENKGCYIGQELTTRCFTTGVLRKRLVPVKIPDCQSLQNGKEVDDYLEVELNEDYLPDSLKPQKMGMSPFASSIFKDSDRDKHREGGKDNKITRKRRKRPVGTLVAHKGKYGAIILRTEYFPIAFDKENFNQDKFFVMKDGKQINLVPLEQCWYKDWVIKR